MDALKTFIDKSSIDISHIVELVNTSDKKFIIVVGNEMIKRYFCNTFPAVTANVITLAEIERFTSSEPYTIIWHDSVLTLAAKVGLSTSSMNDFME